MNEEYELIEIRAIKSYDGIALSFDSKNYFNLYYLYMENGNGFEYIDSSKTPIFKNTKIKIGNKYYVDGFRIENNEFILKGKSNIYECSIINKESFDKPIISIVCPLYNEENYISNCIDSILLSTQNKIEMIIVDDGSTDNSKNVVDWYLKEYPNIIKYYYQENQGVSFARNKGIKYVTGEYTSFIDSDDCIHPRMLEELYKTCVRENSPIAIGKTIIIKPDESIDYVLNLSNENNLDSFSLSYDEMMNYKINNDNNIYFVAVWNKIIRSDIVKNHLFPKYNHYEDVAYTRVIYSYIDKFSFSFNAYYIWDQRNRKKEGSESTRNYVTKTSDDITNLNEKFFNSHFYGYEYGNKEKKDWLSYDVIKDIYDYLKSNNLVEKNNGIYIIVSRKIKNCFPKSFLLNNSHIVNDKELLSFIEDIMEE